MIIFPFIVFVPLKNNYVCVSKEKFVKSRTNKKIIACENPDIKIYDDDKKE